MASETYFLFAPLAHRLGYYNIKSEMEDLSMRLMEPAEYHEIEARLKQRRPPGTGSYGNSGSLPAEKLDALGHKVRAKSRTRIHTLLLAER
ncbi:MAG: hypothetical protein U5L72_19205 [Bacteroidales bacterium]|nr:hypothetical protein [Bacteroidales bacterium]